MIMNLVVFVVGVVIGLVLNKLYKLLVEYRRRYLWKKSGQYWTGIWSKAVDIDGRWRKANVDPEPIDDFKQKDVDIFEKV